MTSAPPSPRISQTPNLLTFEGVNWQVDREWTQATTGAVCAVLSSDQSEHRLFVKVDDHAPAGWSARAHHAYVALDPTSKAEDRLTPRPVGWTAEPPAICYEWSDGRLLYEQSRNLLEQARLDDLDRLVQAVGGALHGLHVRWTRGLPTAATGEVLTKRYRLFGFICGVGTHRWNDRLIHSTSDLGPWNIVVNGDAVTFIDLDEGTCKPVEVDVGILLHRLQIMVLKATKVRPELAIGERRSIASHVSLAVAAGYTAESTDSASPGLYMPLVHAVAAADAVTVGLFRTTHSRNRADLRAASRRFRFAVDQIVSAWTTHVRRLATFGARVQPRVRLRQQPRT